MTIKNFDALATNLDGGLILDNGEPLILKDLIASVLCATFPGEQNLEGVKKYERAALALKIKAGGDIDLKIEELALINDLVGKGAIPVVVFQIYNILNGE